MIQTNRFTKRLRSNHRPRGCFPTPTPYHHIITAFLQQGNESRTPEKTVASGTLTLIATASSVVLFERGLGIVVNL